MTMTASAAIPPVQKDLGRAKAVVSASEMEITTGVISRKWQWTGAGWRTSSLRNVADNQEYAKSGGPACDWSLPGKLDDKSTAELAACTITENNDEGLTGKHLEIISTVNYPQAGLAIQHVVWVYPDAPGVRTQLRVKAMPGFDPKSAVADDRPYNLYGSTQLAQGARADFLPLDFTVANSRRYWGMFNDPGNRLPQDKPMLQENVVTGYPVFRTEANNWASGIAVEYGDAGVAMVKESPKTVNQPAYLTGGFFSGLQNRGLSSTGWGLAPTEIVPDRFRECWAQWTIVYSGGNDGLQTALKRFDAARYPVFPERDMFILSNTWGPADPGGARFTSEEFVLKEIAEVGKLGIDVMQIDDGWQMSGGGPGASGFLPKYKNGWKDIKAAADKAGVRMGLWVAIRNAKVEDLKQNLDELGYITWKADFEHLNSRTDYEQRIERYRAVMSHAPGKTQFTLCPEYDDPRYGWYFAKEFGSIYFQNIQEGLPEQLTFVPFQVLRQHWLMAKYFPTNKLQVMLQNPKRTRKDLSDASQHGHGYCFAMGLPFVPQFFQSAQYLDEEGQKELKELIAAYKQARPDIFTSTTYPIGNLPDNTSWTGFQMVSTTRANGGHLLIFREMHNPNPKATVQLKFLAGKTLALTNLLTSEKSTVTVAADGTAMFEIPNPADYRLFRYEIQ